MTVVAVAARYAANSVAGLLGAERFEDPENARTIMLMAGGLLVLAVLVAVGTVWWWRSTKVEHPALAPLEVMGTRSWWKGDYSARRRRLDAARPAGELIEGESAKSDAVDLDAVRRGSPPHFDDLADGPPVAAPEGGVAAELDALLAAAGAVIVSVHSAEGRHGSSSAVVEPAAEVVVSSLATDAEPTVSATTPAMVGESVAPDDPTAAVEGARAPMDPLLRVPRTD